MIPKTICNIVYLDLSNNRLTRMIPQCLIEFGNGLGVLNWQKMVGVVKSREGTYMYFAGSETCGTHKV